MNEIKFEYGKRFVDLQGNVVSMRALLTIHGSKFIEVNENSNWYKPEEVRELQENEVIFEEIL